MPIYVKLGNVVYKIRHVGPDELAKDCFGTCDSPDSDGDYPEIRLSHDVYGLSELDTICHEVTHAVTFDVLHEKVVADIGTAIAKTLWQMGYRKVKVEETR